MTRSVKRLFRTAAIINGRSRDQIINEVGGSRATLTRDIQTLRELGVDVRYDGERYQVKLSAVINLPSLRLLRLL